MKRIIFTALIALSLTACNKPAEAPKVRKPAAERQHTTVIRDVGNNELIVLEVPTAGLVGLPETTNCFVWRDKEFKTASISCTKPELDLSKD